MAKTKEILNEFSRRRRDLAMPLDELARRSNLSVSTVKRVLNGDVAARLCSVAAISDVLGVKLVLTGAKDISTMRRRQAKEKAKKLVSTVQGSAALEGQAVDQSSVKLMEEKTELELLRGRGASSRLWAE